MSDQAEPRFSSLTVRLQDWWSDGSTVRTGVLVLLVIYLLVSLVLGFIWSSEPDAFAVRESANSRAEAMGVSPVTGFTTTSTLITITDSLLHKPGGYLSNDVFPIGNLAYWFRCGIFPGHYARTSAALKVSQRKTRIWPSQNHS